MSWRLAGVALLGAGAAFAETPGPSPAPTLQEIRSEMGIPSRGDVRGQRDTGLGVTAPSNLHHFVGYPGVAVVLPEPATTP